MRSHYQYNIKQKGSALTLAVLVFVVVAGAVVLGLVRSSQVSVRIANSVGVSSNALVTNESLEEDVVYRIKKGMQYDSEESIGLNGGGATTTIADDVVTGIKTASTVSSIKGFVRKKVIRLLKTDEAKFNYGVQVGLGGLRMKNTASVTGNVYSNGPVEGDSKNVVRGDIISSGPIGLAKEVNSTSSVYAHTIDKSTITKDAYYQVLTNTTVGGIKYPGSADQPTKSLPISDTTLDSWEDIAEQGGVITSPCPYKITTDVTLGPIKIDCDLEVNKKDAVLTMTGMIWVKGDIVIKDDAKLKVSPSVGAKSVALIADDPVNRLTKGTINLEKKSEYYGSGIGNSYVMIVARNTSAENGGDTKGIEMKNDAEGEVILYSNHGSIVVNNKAKLREATGYQVELRNDSNLEYKSGLANTIFETGPGGSWIIIDWKEVQ
ncbi:MAG TPA: hypothetical protein VJJ22_02475 [Candidatus Paceibacterota bacterium]